MGGGVARPGVHAGGQVRAPPALLPAPESPSEGIPEAPFPLPLPLGLLLLWLRISLPEGLTQLGKGAKGG